MNTNVASFRDVKPSRVKRQMEQPSGVPSGAPDVFTDMSDGILALDFALQFAGFEHKASQLVLHIVGLIGGSDKPLVMKDEDIASHLKCCRETIVRWRQAHKQAALTKRFGFLIIEEDEYNREKKFYGTTGYRLNPDVREFVNTAVAVAQASSSYTTDRESAIKKAAEEAYDSMPDAPPLHRSRKGKRRRKDDKSVLRTLEAARKGLTNSKMNLQEMDGGVRQKFLDAQGSDIRQKLLEMQSEIDVYLEMLPQTFSTQEVTDPCDFRSHPPRAITPPGDDGHSKSFPSTVTSVDDADHAPEEGEESPEEFEAFGQEAWERTFACLSRPQVMRTEIEVESRPPDESPPTEPDGATGGGALRGVSDGAPAKDLAPRPEQSTPPAPRYEPGALIYPCTPEGELLHDEPSSVAERRLSSGGVWQYRLEGFTQWRDETLFAQASIEEHDST